MIDDALSLCLCAKRFLLIEKVLFCIVTIYYLWFCVIHCNVKVEQMGYILFWRWIPTTAYTSIFRVWAVIVVPSVRRARSKLRLPTLALDIIEKNLARSFPEVSSTVSFDIVCRITELATYHFSVTVIPIIVTHCPPCSVVVDLNPTLHVWWPSYQTNGIVRASCKPRRCCFVVITCNIQNHGNSGCINIGIWRMFFFSFAKIKTKTRGTWAPVGNRSPVSDHLTTDDTHHSCYSGDYYQNKGDSDKTQDSYDSVILSWSILGPKNNFQYISHFYGKTSAFILNHTTICRCFLVSIVII